MTTYAEMRETQQAEFNTFPIMFAFSDKQFEEGMRKLGLDPSDTDKVYTWSEVSGFYRRSDAPVLHEMLERHSREMEEAVAADPTGEGFILSMFAYELANHEYGYTRDLTGTLEALGLTEMEVNADPRLMRGLSLAIEAQRDPASKSYHIGKEKQI